MSPGWTLPVSVPLHSKEQNMRLHEESDFNEILVSFQGLVTFKDVAVCFSQDQWSDLDPTQKEFYGEYVLEEDCGIVVSLCKEFQVFLECQIFSCWKLRASETLDFMYSTSLVATPPVRLKES